MNREQEIFEIIEQNPGATGATIFMKLVARSWAARWFGPDSIWTMILTPSLGGIYVHLMRLEHHKRVRSEWGMKVGDKPRRRHYYPLDSKTKSPPHRAGS